MVKKIRFLSIFDTKIQIVMKKFLDKNLIFGIVCNVAKTLGIGTDMEWFIPGKKLPKTLETAWSKDKHKGWENERRRRTEIESKKKEGKKTRWYIAYRVSRQVLERELSNILKLEKVRWSHISASETSYVYLLQFNLTKFSKT